MIELPLLYGLILAGAGVLSLFMILVFLTLVYLKGGKDDLLAAAKAVHQVRDVGVGPAVRKALEKRRGS